MLARVNRGELSQRAAGEILGVSHTWVRDRTKRYFSKDGQRLTGRPEPEPDERIPLIERVDRGQISPRAAADELGVSDARIKPMLAHVRGEAPDPTITRKAMDAKLAEADHAQRYRQRQHTIEPVFANIKANLGYRRFTRRALTQSPASGAPSAPATTPSSSGAPASPEPPEPRRAHPHPVCHGFMRQPLFCHSRHHLIHDQHWRLAGTANNLTVHPPDDGPARLRRRLPQSSSVRPCA